MNNLAPYKTTTNKRFVIHKNLHLGSRGPSGPEYKLEDTELNEVSNFSNMADLKCSIVNTQTGLELSPWFGANAKDGHYKDISYGFKPKFISLPEWAEYQ